MFVIKNTTDRDIVLGDLRVVLGPKKEIDLDKVSSRPQVESSVSLRKAVARGMIKVTAKDIDEFSATSTTPSVDKKALGDMEGRIKAEIAKQMAHATQKQRSDADQISALTATVQQLIAQLAKGFPVQQVAQQNTVSDSSAGDISDDIANRIHAKSMKKLEKQITGGSIEHDTTKMTNDQLSKNIDELEGLL